MDQNQQIPTIKPAFSAKPFWLRLIQGSSSWLGIFTDEAYSSDQLSAHIGGLNFKLINKPSEIKQIMQENMSSYPKHELTHYPFVVWAQFYLLPFYLPDCFKFLIVFTFAFFFSWLASFLIRLSPRARYLLGG